MMKHLYFSVNKRILSILIFLVEGLCFGNFKQFGAPSPQIHRIPTPMMSRCLWNGARVDRGKNGKYGSRRMNACCRYDEGACNNCGTGEVGDENIQEVAPIVVGGSGGFPSAPNQWQTIINCTASTQTALVLSDKRSRMREIFDLELKLAAGLSEIEWGLWKSSRLVPHDALSCLASTRAQIKILAGLVSKKIFWLDRLSLYPLDQRTS